MTATTTADLRNHATRIRSIGRDEFAYYVTAVAEMVPAQDRDDMLGGWTPSPEDWGTDR